MACLLIKDGKVNYSEIRTKLGALAAESLAALPTTYAQMFAAIVKLANGSSDPAILAAKAEADLLKKEYQSMQAVTTAVTASIGN